MGPLLAGLASAALPHLVDWGVNKVKGVPTPEKVPTGAEEGANYSGFMDKAFPGTTPWERLGASTGSFAGSSLGAKSEQNIRKAEFKQQRDITKMNNISSIISSAAALGPDAMREALSMYSAGGMLPSNSYDTPVKQERELLPSKKKKLEEEGRRTGFEADQEKEMAERAEEFAKLKIWQARMGILGSGVGATLGGMAGGLGVKSMLHAGKFGVRHMGKVGRAVKAVSKFRRKG